MFQILESATYQTILFLEYQCLRKCLLITKGVNFFFMFCIIDDNDIYMPLKMLFYISPFFCTNYYYDVIFW